MHLVHVVGARPNFMKVAPVMTALERRAGVRQTLVHTGQHYGSCMSDVFFRELEIPRPDVCLDVGSASHAAQTGRIMIRLERVLQQRRTDLVLVYGDVNSTVAAALVAAKLQIRVGHVEAGLRSFDASMPEEINRRVTDHLSEILLTPSGDGDENLIREGIPSEKIHRVGNVMIDTLVRLLPRACLPPIDGIDGRYALVTLHRPSNVDDPVMLTKILEALAAITRDCEIIFPVHPRTRKRIAEIGAMQRIGNSMRLLEPLGYLEFLALQQHATFVLTDSGGIQEETTYLGVPCLTLRENTERPITVEVGTNVLVGQDMGRLRREVERILSGYTPAGSVPLLWDGRAADRIADAVAGGVERTVKENQLAA